MIEISKTQAVELWNSKTIYAYSIAESVDWQINIDNDVSKLDDIITISDYLFIED